LPEAVRERFSKRLEGGRTVSFVGQIIEARFSRCGWLLAQALRLIGGPLPFCRDTLVPAAVSVTEDGSGGGQCWTRLYNRRRGFPQVVHSAKRFAGPTGLEEHIGAGFGIALTLSADAHALHFHSAHFFFACGPVRLRLPGWMSPGALTISHVDCGDGWFAFVLALRHRWLGELVHQTALFRERRDPQQELA
jgi:hypothetical protein